MRAPACIMVWRAGLAGASDPDPRDVQRAAPAFEQQRRLARHRRVLLLTGQASVPSPRAPDIRVEADGPT
jgi:hypothetical protein